MHFKRRITLQNKKTLTLVGDYLKEKKDNVGVISLNWLVPYSLQNHIHPPGEGSLLHCVPLTWGKRNGDLTQHAAVLQGNSVAPMLSLSRSNEEHQRLCDYCESNRSFKNGTYTCTPHQKTTQHETIWKAQTCLLMSRVFWMQIISKLKRMYMTGYCHNAKYNNLENGYKEGTRVYFSKVGYNKV